MALAVWQSTIVNRSGDVQPNAQVEVRLESSGALAAIYADRDGTTPLSNPFNADENGFARFYAAGGAYKITASLGSFSQTYRHVAIGLLGEQDQPWYDRTAAEIAAGVMPVDYGYEPGNVRRYGAKGDGITDDTAAFQTAFDLQAAKATSSGASDPVLSQKRVWVPAGDYLLNTVVIHGSMNIEGEGWASRIIPHPNLPDDGAIFLSLSGSAVSPDDESTNLALLTTVYGAGNEPARRREYDLGGLKIQNLFFHAETPRYVSAIWFTGATQNTVIRNVRCRGLKPDGGVIRLNGSWVFKIDGCSIYGQSQTNREGNGIVLGTTSNGTHRGTRQCNSFTISDCRLQQLRFGIVWRRGNVARIVANDIEFCTIGTHIHAGKSFTYSSNYHERNINRSLGLGGTGTGEDQEVRNAVVTACLFDEDDSTERIGLYNVQESAIFNNQFKGTGTVDITLDAGSENNENNYIECSSFSRVSVNSPGQQRTDHNEYRYMDLPPAPRALVRRGAAQSIPNDTATTLQWTTEVTDVGGWFDGSTDNTVFVVPSGVHKVRLTAFVVWDDNSTGYRQVRVLKNGSVNYPGRTEARAAASGTSQFTLTSAVLPVEAGDEFSLQVLQTSGGPLDVTGGNATYFAIEAVR